MKIEDEYLGLDSFCVCGHMAVEHFGEYCRRCLPTIFRSDRKADDYRHRFQLDNLRLVEEEAKRRKLI